MSVHFEISAEDMNVLWNVLGPNTIARVQIEPTEGGKFRVNYLPSEAGIYAVNMMFNGREVEGEISALVLINCITNLIGWFGFQESAWLKTSFVINPSHGMSWILTTYARRKLRKICAVLALGYFAFCIEA